MKRQKGRSVRRQHKTIEQLHRIIQEQSLLVQMQKTNGLNPQSANANFLTDVKDPLTALTVNITILNSQIEKIYPILCEIEPLVLQLPGTNLKKSFRRLVNRCRQLPSKSWRMDLFEILTDSAASIHKIAAQVKAETIRVGQKRSA